MRSVGEAKERTNKGVLLVHPPGSIRIFSLNCMLQTFVEDDCCCFFFLLLLFPDPWFSKNQLSQTLESGFNLWQGLSGQLDVSGNSLDDVKGEG